MNTGQQLINDAVNAGISDMVTMLYAGAVIVGLLALVMVKNALTTAKYRR